jgi:allophanate hydrolase subunit 2
MKLISNLKVVKTGPGTSVQDLGRNVFSEFGVPYSGALDKRAFNWANHLLRNQESAAMLEIMQPGFKAVFETPTLICLAGAKASCTLNQIPIHTHGLIRIQANNVLEIGKFERGSIVYLGIKNGFQTEKKLDSQSWYPGITPEFMIQKGDTLPYTPVDPSFFESNSNARWNSDLYNSELIEVYSGPDWRLLDLEGQVAIFENRFTLSSLKNRMAVQLEELIPNSIPELPTAPVFPGTVQLTSGGKLLILLRDAQVTGGYPRILQLSESAISLISQKNPLQKIRFTFLKN